MLGAGCWVLGAGCGVLGAGCGVLGARYWVLGAGCGVREILKNHFCQVIPHFLDKFVTKE
jgi:hypothetical protein